MILNCLQLLMEWKNYKLVGYLYFQILFTAINENEFEVSEWKDYKTVWAKVFKFKW